MAQANGSGDRKVGSVIEKCPLQEESKDQDIEKVTIRATIFFDGTMNNRTNVDIGNRLKSQLAQETDPQKKKELEKQIKKKVDGSYANDYSNVARAVGYCKDSTDYDYTIRKYIEGIGTEDEKEDSTVIGGGLGMGETGVKAKVKKALSFIQDDISESKGKIEKKKIKHIHLDAVGFSRGAAAARFFIHAALNDPESNLNAKLEQKGYEVDEVKVRFIGLFDTVASYGVVHSNDTNDLKLHSISQAERVVQLCASEEYRENFRLTNINSAANGLELFLPGAHSDIGGGYTEPSDEEDMTILSLPVPQDNWERRFQYMKQVERRLRSERQMLIAAGWYDPDEDEIDIARNGLQLKVTRQGISQKYSFIPLHLMVRYLREWQITVSQKIKIKYAVPNKLKNVQEAIDEKINSNDCSDPVAWQSNDQMLRELRHNYLHFSSRFDGIGHKPQFDNGDIMNGRRQRIIQNG